VRSTTLEEKGKGVIGVGGHRGGKHVLLKQKTLLKVTVCRGVVPCSLGN
jgi:hypothetical protein